MKVTDTLALSHFQKIISKLGPSRILMMSLFLEQNVDLKKKIYEDLNKNEESKARGQRELQKL